MAHLGRVLGQGLVDAPDGVFEPPQVLADSLAAPDGREPVQGLVVALVDAAVDQRRARAAVPRVQDGRGADRVGAKRGGRHHDAAPGSLAGGPGQRQGTFSAGNNIIINGSVGYTRTTSGSDSGRRRATGGDRKGETAGAEPVGPGEQKAQRGGPLGHRGRGDQQGAASARGWQSRVCAAVLLPTAGPVKGGRPVVPVTTVAAAAAAVVALTVFVRRTRATEHSSADPAGLSMGGGLADGQVPPEDLPEPIRRPPEPPAALLLLLLPAATCPLRLPPAI